MSGRGTPKESTSQRSNSQERPPFVRSAAPSPQPQNPDSRDLGHLTAYGAKPQFGAPNVTPERNTPCFEENWTRSASPASRSTSVVSSVEIWERRSPQSDCRHSHESFRGASQYRSVHGSQAPELCTPPRTPRSVYDHTGHRLQASQGNVNLDNRCKRDSPASDSRGK